MRRNALCVNPLSVTDCEGFVRIALFRQFCLTCDAHAF